MYRGGAPGKRVGAQKGSFAEGLHAREWANKTIAYGGSFC